MKRALSEKEIAQLETRSNQPIEGTYEALRREDYPALKSIDLNNVSSANPIDAMRSWSKREREQGNDEFADLLDRKIAALAIPESDLVQ